MPIRIKPVHDLKPCVLDLDSIKEICSLVEQNFNSVRLSAEDGVWEVYNEGRENFISAISPRETLDSFTVHAQHIVEIRQETEHGIAIFPNIVEKKIQLIFDKREATVKFTGPHELENWFEHFMIDLKKHLRPPLFRQRLLTDRDNNLYGSLSLALAGMTAARLSGGRYCQIILNKRPPNVFVENVKANLASNLIWAIIVFVAGSLFTLVSLWVYKKYGVHLSCDGLC